MIKRETMGFLATAVAAVVIAFGASMVTAPQFVNWVQSVGKEEVSTSTQRALTSEQWEQVQPGDFLVHSNGRLWVVTSIGSASRDQGKRVCVERGRVDTLSPPHCFNREEAESNGVMEIILVGKSKEWDKWTHAAHTYLGSDVPILRSNP